MIAALVSSITPDADDTGAACQAFSGAASHTWVSSRRRTANGPAGSCVSSPQVSLNAACNGDEDQLYEGFPSRQDERLRERMLGMSPEAFVQHVPALSDPRLREHASRRAFALFPQALPDAERARLDRWSQDRLHATGKQRGVRSPTRATRSTACALSPSTLLLKPPVTATK